jgi:hypothetical protein
MVIIYILNLPFLNLACKKNQTLPEKFPAGYTKKGEPCPKKPSASLEILA